MLLCVRACSATAKQYTYKCECFRECDAEKGGSCVHVFLHIICRHYSSAYRDRRRHRLTHNQCRAACTTKDTTLARPMMPTSAIFRVTLVELHIKYIVDILHSPNPKCGLRCAICSIWLLLFYVICDVTDTDDRDDDDGHAVMIVMMFSSLEKERETERE